MYALTWGAPKDRQYEYGVSKGVHYMKDAEGVYKNAAPWNGLINVTDSPSGADNTKLFADGIEYAALRASETYGLSIEAYTYPDQFAECDGYTQPVPGLFVGQQTRKPFGMCWRTEIGNADNPEDGYFLHIAYGITVSPSEQSHDTVNDNPDAATFSWDGEATPVPFAKGKPTAKLKIDSRKFKDKMADLEKKLYGDDSGEATLPTPDEIIKILNPSEAV